jgi:phage recombination protein Bet
MTNVSSFPAAIREPPPTVPSIPDIPKQTILDFLSAFGLASQLTEPEKLQFIEVAQAFRLNPFRREVHCVVYGDGEYRRMSIVVGYEVYLKRAERTGKLDGWSTRIEGEGENMKALVEIHRKDWAEPFVHEAYWREAVQKKKDGTPTAFWTKQPRFQLKKVAISQGFRLCFPDELGGLPYDASELPDAETVVPVTTGSPIPEARSVEVPPSMDNTPIIAEAPHSVPGELKLPAAEPSDAPPSEPVSIRFIEHHDRYPDEPQDALLRRLESYLDDNYEAFGEKHKDWIFEKAKHSRDREGVLKMLSYAQKVVKNVGAVAGASA